MSDCNGGDAKVHQPHLSMLTPEIGGDDSGGFIETQETHLFPRGQMPFQAFVRLW